MKLRLHQFLSKTGVFASKAPGTRSEVREPRRGPVSENRPRLRGRRARTISRHRASDTASRSRADDRSATTDDTSVTPGL